MIALEHVRALIDNPPEHVLGETTPFCDFAGPGDESVLARCRGNRFEIVDHCLIRRYALLFRCGEAACLTHSFVMTLVMTH
jgi:hypothetical protein